MIRESKECANCEKIIWIEQPDPESFELDNVAYFCGLHCEDRYYNGVEVNCTRWYTTSANG
jgi:hypothetical protein